jgi:two-component system nitrate/nitrite response regulator NarL
VAQVVTTIIVDADNLFREGLRLILSTTLFRVAKVVSAIDDIPPHRGRTVLILVGLSGDHIAQAAAVRRIKAKHPTARVVILTDQCTLDEALALFRAGADGYLNEQISCDALVKALDLVMLGVTTLGAVSCTLAVNKAVSDSSEVSGFEMPANVVDFAHEGRRLSHREVGIFRCLMRGDANKTIARELQITEATVKVHIKAILRKIRVRNRTQAAVWAHNHLLDPTTSARVNMANGNGYMNGNGHAEGH